MHLAVQEGSALPTYGMNVRDRQVIPFLEGTFLVKGGANREPRQPWIVQALFCQHRQVQESWRLS